MVNLNLIEPKDLWYTIGLITSDGNLSSDHRHIYITSKDKELLEKIKSALSLTNKIGVKSRAREKEKIYSLLQFGDVKFYRYLISIGLTPKKSLTLGAIKVPRIYFVDFLRGMIDGDGSIHKWVNKSNQYTQWALRITSGAPIFSLWLKNEIEARFGVKGKLYTYHYQGKKNPINLIKFGKFAAKVILEKTYYAGCLCLDRKLKIIQDCLKSENGFIKYGQVVKIL